MDAAAGLGHGPLESPAEALLYFFNQVLPAWKPIFARQHQLGITAATTAVWLWADGHVPGRWRLDRRQRCHGPVSWLVCAGIPARDEQEVSMWSLRLLSRAPVTR